MLFRYLNQSFLLLNSLFLLVKEQKLNLPPEKSLSVIYRRVIAQCIAGTVFIVEIHVFLRNFHELFSVTTFIYLKVHVQFFLHPAVYGLIYRFIRWLPNPGHA